MALEDDLVRVQQAHHGELLRIRQASAGLVEDAWDAYAGLSTSDARAFSSAAAQITTAAQQQTAVMASAYLEANDRLLGQRSQLVPALQPIRNGIPPAEVYERSIIQARTNVGDGMPVTQALEAGKARAATTMRTDVVLQNRQSIDAQRRPWVVGYRRVLTGQSCALCATASTQRYRTAELDPIHPNCDCDVAEIYGEADPGQVVNRQLLDDLQAAAGEDGRPDYWNGPYLVDEQGVVRRSKVQTVRDGNGEIVRLPNGRPKRERVPLEPFRTRTSTHGEMGELLTDAKHKVSSIPDDYEPPRNPVAPRVVDDVVEETADVVDEIPPNIVREAAEEAGERAKVPDLDPDILAAAEREGVSYDEVKEALERLPDVRRMIRDEAAVVQREAFEQLDQWDALKIKRPGRPGQRAAEYDFLEQVDARERARLSRSFYSDSPADAPDLIAQRMEFNSGRAYDTLDEALSDWLRVTRDYEAAGALRRGKLPSSRAYSGEIDVDNLLPQAREEGYSIRRIFGRDDVDGAAHVAAVERDLLEEYARRELGVSRNPVEGPSPFRMSFQSWEEEVRTLEYGLREYPGEMPANARARLAELVPANIDEPGLDFEDLYARIVTTAQQAGEEVPDYARIPWE